MGQSAAATKRVAERLHSQAETGEETTADWEAEKACSKRTGLRVGLQVQLQVARPDHCAQNEIQNARSSVKPSRQNEHCMTAGKAAT
jgi:hypothetical protein